MIRLSDILGDARETTIDAAASLTEDAVSLPDRVQIVGKVLEWSDGASEGRMREGRLNDACLSRFVQLADARPKQFETFALRYGPLYLGQDGWPVATLDYLPSRVDEDEPLRVWYQEPLEGWRAWSRYIRAVFALGHELRFGKRIIVTEARLRELGLTPGPREFIPNDDSPLLTIDLGRTVYDRLWPGRLFSLVEAAQTADLQWDYFAGDVNTTLLEVVNFTVHLRGTRHIPQVKLEQSFGSWLGRPVHSALPTIAGQLLANISGSGWAHVCAKCGRSYPVQRRTKNGLCPVCRRRARSDSAQLSKARRREREALLASGS